VNHHPLGLDDGDQADLREQVEYYRAIAGEYETHKIDANGGEELLAAFQNFDIGGDVLELTCGLGQWTSQLAGRADSVTAVDASPEMIARARERVGDAEVQFIESDLFSWTPARQYDSVFFGFWLSHVPDERFEAFWSMVDDCLTPDGHVFFVDDNHWSLEELIEGPDSSIVERRLNNGTAFRAVKVPHEPAQLQRQLETLGWEIAVSSAGPFYWGDGGRRG